MHPLTAVSNEDAATKHTHMHACTHTHMHTQSHTHTHALAHARMHARTNTYVPAGSRTRGTVGAWPISYSHAGRVTHT